MAYLYRIVTRRDAMSRYRREESMKQLRSSRHLIKMWHRREKATIDYLVKSIDPANNPARLAHSAFTPSGLAIEDQVRKAWQPVSVGIAMF